MPGKADTTILVVDDETSILELARHVLEPAGFVVQTVEDGKTAVQVFARRPEKIRAVLVDLSMPEMGGLEVVQELRKLQPDLPIVLMSGYSEEELAGQFQREGLAGCLSKPFRPVQLLDLVQRVLGC